jgi:hypothetical protein
VSLTIWLPSSAEHGDRKLVSGVDTTREIVDRCRVCQEFVVYEGEHPRTMELHLRRCLRANHDRLMAERERQHPSVMLPWDTDFSSWMQRHREAVLEGRKKP